MRIVGFVLNSILLGAGLAMDAFSVSVANALNEPEMKKEKMCLIAGVFAGFQALMPMTGWVCVSTVMRYFKLFEKSVPWIAFVLLVIIGGKMLLEGLCAGVDGSGTIGIGTGALLIQGIATSIDALSVGFTIADYGCRMAVSASLIIASVTFILCVIGLKLGKQLGIHMADRAQAVGGIILIIIGLKIII